MPGTRLTSLALALALALGGCAFKFDQRAVTRDAGTDAESDVDTAVDPDVPPDIPDDLEDLDSTGDMDVPDTDLDAPDMDGPEDTLEVLDTTIEDTAVDDIVAEEIFVNPYAPLDLLFSDLPTYISSITDRICTTSAAMPIPTSTRRNQWGWLLDDLFDLPVNWVQIWSRSTTNNFSIQPIRDPVNGDYIVISDDDNCEGIYVFDLDTSSRLVVQVPYPVNDTGAMDLGIGTFQQTGAWVLMIAGADRCSDPTTLPCDGQTSACIGSLENAHTSDAGLNLLLIFQKIHEYLFTGDSTSRALQIQDMADTSAADIVTSDGTTIDSSFPPLGLAVRLRNQLRGRPDLASFSSSIVSCNAPADAGSGYSSLCSEANVQGRHSNGSSSLCGTPAPASSNRYIALELSSTMLGNPTYEADIIIAIDALF
jgi:hypothetical protein